MVMTVLTLLPAMLITMTAFTRILIVLAILVRRYGSTDAFQPDHPRSVAVLTLFIMSPVIDLVWVQALSPYLDGQVGFEDALNTAQVPLREFMFSQARV